MSRPRTLLVLGGTAWLGGLVAARAAATGWAVTCLARATNQGPPPGTRLVRADRDSPNAMAEVRGTAWDAVVDLTRHPGHARDAAVQLDARRVVFVSSASVYADHSQPGADERAPILAPHPGPTLTDPQDYGAAKVACELAWLAGRTTATVVRPGLIAGPGDQSDRTGYWPLRFAQQAHGARGHTSARPVLAPLGAGLTAQVIDVRDLANWIVDLAGEQQADQVYNAVGNPMPLVDHLGLACQVAGGHPPLQVPDDWLVAQGVNPWAGPRSLPLWLPDPAYRGFAARDNRSARAHGLQLRPLADTLQDTLEWEIGRDHPDRSAGLTPAQEQELWEAWECFDARS